MRLKSLDGIFLLAGIFIFALRIGFGRMVSVWFNPAELYDDGLLMRYADLHGHFVAQDTSIYEALLKDMGFPVLLNLVGISGLQYTDALAIFWLLAAISLVIFFAEVTGVTNRLIWLAIYIFVLFTPAAFDDWCGTRLYRNAALTPLYFIVLNMCGILFARHFLSTFDFKKFLPFQIFLGLIFTLTFYIKEDGIWLLAVLGAVLILCLIKTLIKNSAVEEKFFHVTALILPLVIFGAGTIFYKSVNEKYFGVYVINTRTEGETGKFVKLVYKIESDERTGKIWAPHDAVQKAIAASKTLQDNPKLTEAILHSPWCGGDMAANPVRGDFLGWVTMTALKESGVCNSIFAQENLFRKVNSELEAAFEDGTLKKDSKFQLVSSMGGRSLWEMLKLSPLVLKEYFMHVLLYKYSPGAYSERYNPPEDSAQEKILATAVSLTNIELEKPNDFAGALVIFLRWIFFTIYRVIYLILFAAAIIGLKRGVVEFWRSKNKLADKFFFLNLIPAGYLILSLVYAFALAWFCEFITPNDLRYVALKFYSVGLIPMLMSFEIFGAYLFYKKSRRN